MEIEKSNGTEKIKKLALLSLKAILTAINSVWYIPYDNTQNNARKSLRGYFKFIFLGNVSNF